MEKATYQVVITKPAQVRYFDTILHYLYQHFSFERADEIDSLIKEKVSSLAINPHRGTKEPLLLNFTQDFRFVLFRETRHFELKIIYFIDDSSQTVIVTDFFPTRMNPSNIAKHSGS